MVTSHDVARLAGVSQPTVSRALREMTGVAPETVQRVRAAADQLGYIPSEAGRTLSTRKTGTIGIVSAELTNPFYPELVQPIRDELEASGYRTLLIPDSSDAPLQAARLCDGALDGVVLTTSFAHSALPQQLREYGLPHVLANRLVEGSDADSCAFDNSDGAQLAAAHLIERGHRHIGMISGPLETSTGREREEAFLTALAARGVQVRDDHRHRGDFTFASGYKGAFRMLAAPTPPTALFCGNDVVALGAINALKERGVTAGSDVAVVGFDDIPMAAWPVFDLTTIRCDRATMAKESVRMLMRRLESLEHSSDHVVIPVHLIQRGSG